MSDETTEIHIPRDQAVDKLRGVEKELRGEIAELLKLCLKNIQSKGEFDADQLELDLSDAVLKAGEMRGFSNAVADLLEVDGDSSDEDEDEKEEESED